MDCDEGLQKIVSGGQTGVDRAALDVAIQLGISHGGWCPLGRRAEDGTIPLHYELSQTDSPEYHVRTRMNVIDSDATLVLYRGTLQGGTALTVDMANRQGRPCLPLNLDQPLDLEAFRQWLRANRVQTLNIAGPRASQSPGIYESAVGALWLLLDGPKTDGQ